MDSSRAHHKTLTCPNACSEVISVQAPTQAPSQFDVHRVRTRRVVTVVLVVSVALFWYGASVAGFDPLSGSPNLWLVGHYLLVIGGLLLVSVTALVTLWFSRQEEPRPFPRRTTVLIGVVAPLVSAGILAAGYWVEVGDGPLAVERTGWLLAGLTALAGQLYAGSLDPGPARGRLAGLELLSVPTFVLSVLAVGLKGSPTPGFLGLLFALAIVFFVLFGGMLYLLGYLLVRRPRYYRIG